MVLLSQTWDQIIPPVKTDAIGYIGLKYPDDMSKMVYTVNAENIGNVDWYLLLFRG